MKTVTIHIERIVSATKEDKGDFNFHEGDFYNIYHDVIADKGLADNASVNKFFAFQIIKIDKDSVLIKKILPPISAIENKLVYEVPLTGDQPVELPFEQYGVYVLTLKQLKEVIRNAPFDSELRELEPTQEDIENAKKEMEAMSKEIKSQKTTPPEPTGGFIDDDPRYKEIEKDVADKFMQEKIEKFEKGEKVSLLGYPAKLIHQIFSRRYPEAYKAYSKNEYFHAYKNPYLDPVYESLVNEIQAITEQLKSKYNYSLEQTKEQRKPFYKEVGELTVSAISSFVNAYPEKVAAYSKDPSDKILNSLKGQERD